MTEWLEQLTTSPAGQGLPLWKSWVLFAHAVAIGSYLLFLDWKMSRNGSLLASASVLFVCVGMTSVMILVNDNLARAFAIGAAIALIRFRVKMAGKFIGVGLFYAVLTGMACGLDRVDIAWSLALLFGILLAVILRVQNKLSPGPSREN
ncbi:MAG: hypothetical protein NDJ90_07835 [Oligoflexia bacterium]|nr:hypothetical protein [Oligoflexia bacterium]